MFSDIVINLFSIQNFLLLNLGVAVGIIFGAIPGLSSVIGITLLLPITYTLNIYSSLCVLIGVYCGGIYGGSVSAILIDTPGLRLPHVRFWTVIRWRERGWRAVRFPSRCVPALWEELSVFSYCCFWSRPWPDLPSASVRLRCSPFA